MTKGNTEDELVAAAVEGSQFELKIDTVKLHCIYYQSKAYAILHDEKKLSHATIAERVGRDASTVKRRIAFFNLVELLPRLMNCAEVTDYTKINGFSTQLKKSVCNNEEDTKFLCEDSSAAISVEFGQKIIDLPTIGCGDDTGSVDEDDSAEPPAAQQTNLGVGSPGQGLNDALDRATVTSFDFLLFVFY